MLPGLTAPSSPLKLLFQPVWTGPHKLESSRNLSKPFFPESFYPFHCSSQVSWRCTSNSRKKHTLGPFRPRVLCFYSLQIEIDTPLHLKKGSWLSEKSTGQRARGLFCLLPVSCGLTSPHQFLLLGILRTDSTYFWRGLPIASTLCLTYRGLILS